ncbi:N-acetyltransferase [Streptomyces sp. NPDC126499]|uniref:N-acetyltransferase n=1 Tax=Streptomyces sp. NPDC126499 TaxID=3155314 RepID=UPI00332C69E8
MAYREIELLPCPAPEANGEDCLLLVHIRKVVGRVTYRACDRCAEGVITDLALDEPFLGSGLGTRALSYLRSRYPGVTWRATLDRRFTRDLLRRMRVPMARAGQSCPHLLPPVDAPAGA